jgi:hypothetical protein
MKAKLLYAILLFCLFTLPLFAQEESIYPLEINKYESYAVDVTTGKRYEWSQLEEGVKLETGHKIEFYFTIDRRITAVLIPDNYVLELGTDMDRAVWQYELRESVQGSKAYVWHAKEEHEWSRFTVQLTAYVPKTIDKTKEPGFQRPQVEEDYVLDGIKEKTCCVKLAVYKSFKEGRPGDLDSIVTEISYVATNERIGQFASEIDENLSLIRLEKELSEKYPHHKESADAVLSSSGGLADEIQSLSKDGHPGWALELSQKFESMTENVSELPGPTPFPLFSFLAVAILCAGGGLVAGAFLSRIRRPSPSEDSLDSVVSALDGIVKDMEEHRKSMATVDDPNVRQNRVMLGRFMERIERQVSNLKYFRTDKY